MLGLKATMNIIDNSGAVVAEVVHVLKTKVGHGHGRIGDEVVCVIKKARPISASISPNSPAAANKVRRGDVRHAIIVRTRKEQRRPDGRFIRFDDNAGVLLNNKRELLGTRVNGVVAAELRQKGWARICSLAPKVA